jgi:hypothetical protein
MRGSAPCISMDWRVMIVLSESDVAKRWNKVPRMLAPIAAANKGPRCRVFSRAAGLVVVAAYEGNQSGQDYDRWRFKVRKAHVWGQYYELWKRVGAPESDLFLDRAYLHLIRIDRDGTERKLLALHCDPEWSDPVDLKYKRGPHVHVQCAQDPVPHAHLALAAEHLRHVLVNIDTLSEAFGRGVELLNTEIIRRISA